MRKIAAIILVLMMACSLLSVSFAEGSSDKLKLEQNGSYVVFGRYEQDNNLDNGPEPIEWIVLDVQDGKALLLSRYGLDAKAFDGSTNVWADCSLRAWLNNEFIHEVFNLQERMAILKTETDVGVQDEVFILSYEDTDLYYSSNEGRMCAPTDYAITKGANTNTYEISGRQTGMWWLRPPRRSTDYAAVVCYDGSRLDLSRVDSVHYIVRPAIWLDLNAVTF